MLALGDTQYPSGRLVDYRYSYDRTWGRFRRITLPVPGNHEYGTTGAAGYFRYFGARAHPPRGWYAVDRGAWRIYVLNTNCSAVSCRAERRWLDHDLRVHPSRCSLAAMHHPRFSTGPHGPSSDAKRFWPILDRQQVDVALAGHDHGYERFARMHVDGTVAQDGIRSFVVGTGGASHYPLGPPEHGTQVQESARFGVLFLRLERRSYRWVFRGTDGTRLDRGSSGCLA